LNGEKNGFFDLPAHKLLKGITMENLISDLIRLESYKATKHSQGPLSVVIADDERQMVHLLTISLKTLGHEVIATTDNGEDAVVLALQNRPDLVILDIEMPKLDGLDAARKILSEWSVPIIISSGRSDNDVLKRAQTLNIQAYLVKPFSTDQLKSAISISLSQHEALLSAQLQIAALTNEIDVIKSVNAAATFFMEKFGIERKDALEKLEVAARVRGCTVADVAKQILGTSAPASPAPAAQLSQAGAGHLQKPGN
jgi:response regulator NasT